LPARIFDLPARGLIREGYWADLVVFDPARIQDRATADDPWKPPEGIPFVIENGRLVVRDGKLTGLLPGQPVRRGGAAAE
jgi:N-acyl-D-aspartate/D-glutamate deacylase